jgi:hypothetical protein
MIKNIRIKRANCYRQFNKQIGMSKNMNCKEELNLKYSKFKVQCWAIFAIFNIVLTFTACNKDKNNDCDNDNDNVIEYPSLKAVNQNNDNRSITSISLVGYEFNNLNITIGGSQTFVLDKGMPGGYSDINVQISHKYSAWSGSVSKKINFNTGETTTITLKGCLSFEGCQGFSLE